MNLTSIYIDREGRRRITLTNAAINREVSFTVQKEVYEQLIKLSCFVLQHREDGMELWSPEKK